MNRPMGRSEAAGKVVEAFPGTRVVEGPPAAPEGQGDAYDLPDLDGGLHVPDGRARGEDLVGLLLLLRPLGTMEVSTEYGEKLATDTYVVEVAEPTDEGDAGYVDHGRMPILWKHVRIELDRASREAPWCTGIVVKRKTAYFLNPPTPEQARQARQVLAEFLEDRRAAKAAAEAAARAAQEAARPQRRQPAQQGRRRPQEQGWTAEQAPPLPNPDEPF